MGESCLFKKSEKALSVLLCFFRICIPQEKNIDPVIIGFLYAFQFFFIGGLKCLLTPL
jgi:hypothetical protein